MIELWAPERHPLSWRGREALWEGLRTAQTGATARLQSHWPRLEFVCAAQRGTPPTHHPAVLSCQLVDLGGLRNAATSMPGRECCGN
eukprot:15446446-Alexandrium_andersonii.AAC.1